VCPSSAIIPRYPGVLIPPVEEAVGVVDKDVLSRHLKSNRSIRLFQKTPVSIDIIENLLNVCRFAASGENARPVRWVVVNDPARVQAFSAGCIEWLSTIPDGHPLKSFADAILFLESQQKDIISRGAPAIIIACAEKQHITEHTTLISLIDCIIALTHLDILSSSFGLGTCWDGFASIFISMNPELAKPFDIPDELVFEYAMMIGYPDISYVRIPPRDPAQIWVAGSPGTARTPRQAQRERASR
jgi:nitroreductase